MQKALEYDESPADWQNAPGKVAVILECVYIMLHCPPYLNFMIQYMQQGEFISYK